MSTLPFILLCFLPGASASLLQVELTPSNLQDNAAKVTNLSGNEVYVSSNGWYINGSKLSEWLLKVTLDKASWGFQSEDVSTITIEIEGGYVNTNTYYMPDILMSLSMYDNETEYWAQRGDGLYWTVTSWPYDPDDRVYGTNVYPDCGSSISPESFLTGNIFYAMENIGDGTARWDAIASGRWENVDSIYTGFPDWNKTIVLEYKSNGQLKIITWNTKYETLSKRTCYYQNIPAEQYIDLYITIGERFDASSASYNFFINKFKIKKEILIFYDDMVTYNSWNISSDQDIDSLYSIYSCSPPYYRCIVIHGPDNYIRRSVENEYASYRLQFDITLREMESGDYCKIKYSFDGDNFIDLASYQGQGSAVKTGGLEQEFFFDSDVAEDRLYIELGSDTVTLTGNDNCYYDNVYLYGTDSLPTTSPTTVPSSNPTSMPSQSPTFSPTTSTPTVHPTKSPTISPETVTPTDYPSTNPSVVTSHSPTYSPLILQPPSVSPTVSPSKSPTQKPTQSPTPQPPPPTSMVTSTGIQPEINATNGGNSEFGNPNIDNVSAPTWLIVMIVLVVILICFTIICFVCLLKRSKILYQSSSSVEIASGIMTSKTPKGNGKALISISSVSMHKVMSSLSEVEPGSPTSVENENRFSECDDENGDKAGPGIVPDANGKHQREITMDSFNTPGNLMDDQVKDLDVEMILEDSDNEHVITKGEYALPETTKEEIVSIPSIISDKVSEGQ